MRPSTAELLELARALSAPVLGPDSAPIELHVGSGASAEQVAADAVEALRARRLAAVIGSRGDSDGPDWEVIASRAGLHLVRLLLDERGDRPYVALLSLEPVAVPLRPARPVSLESSGIRSSPADERFQGRAPYVDVLARLHRDMSPRGYLEIGVHRGLSLQLSSCPTVAVDPDPRTRSRGHGKLFHETSDDFFRYDAEQALTMPVDLAFVDGLHLFEFALRDLVNVERHSHPGTLLVVDDVLPSTPVQGRRERASRAWCGDVWKLVGCLERHRPDLTLHVLDTTPSGLLLVSGLDPRNDVLWRHYDDIVEGAIASPADVPASVLTREGAIAADDRAVSDLIASLLATRA